ncbi:uncharacterized protein LOC143446031 [Clavelina lepadiformis]|uniref:uncharacterized protein LOC143446031 n=1 Tax=Clavelina lepadiformis TaxID=159417 RepID=UPI00404326AC
MSLQDVSVRNKEQDAILYSFKGIGIAQLVLAVLLIIFCIVSLCVAAYCCYSPITMVSAGIWCNIWVFPAGLMSIAASKNVTSTTVTWTMISSGVASFFIFVLVVIEIIAFIVSLANPYRDQLALLVIHMFMLSLAMAQLTLCVRSTFVFSRMYCSSPYQPVGLHNATCASCCIPRSQSMGYPQVLYTAINPKPHGS